MKSVMSDITRCDERIAGHPFQKQKIESVAGLFKNYTAVIA